MDDIVRSRRERSDARESTVRIIEAAKAVFTDDPNASLEQVAEHAGLARTTVHRRFASRRSLLAALAVELNEHYLRALDRARVATAPPMVALYRLTEIAFELKIAHPFDICLNPGARGHETPAPDPAIQEGLDLLFTRLHETGQIAVGDPDWCRRIYLALLHEVHELPVDSPVLAGEGGAPEDVVGARVGLLITTLLGALGGSVST
ncbi:TetR/AcrR family transcriptional regulator [Nocardiopsis tropica]|uniref:TetR/AcrR family transcriptional regulator n=1 Tax=Nocardiopsis tropica TaxID=109330 RepID=A0ABU7KY51_9ACTN|nr:TetR/AcrR family transcriptional regulator [Nocardiopsis umidischolae]MEE2054206.1 TetR/AcrR family transcriptional regulator [Nocardiopsis umidischolae]